MTINRKPRRVSLAHSAVRTRVRKARKMRREGYTVRKISEELQVVQSAVHRYLAGNVKVARSSTPVVIPEKTVQPNTPVKKTNSNDTTSVLKALINSNLEDAEKFSLLKQVVSLIS